MDTLTFISNMTSSLIWPVIVFGTLYMLRRPIASLFPKLTKIKFRDLEANFQDLSVSDQSLLFLDGVARKQQWTFFEKARSDERPMGQASKIIVKDLLEVEKNEVIKKLKQWLNSEEANLIWFASEVIGYFRLSELKEELANIIPKDINNDLDHHQLNCLWAYAEITKMKYIADVLIETNSQENQKWLLFLFEQMPISNEFPIDYRIKVIEQFTGRDDLDKEITVRANETLERMKSPSKVN